MCSTHNGGTSPRACWGNFWAAQSSGKLAQAITFTGLSRLQMCNFQISFRSINLQFVGSFSDKLFNDILCHNSFPCLENVSLDQCHRFGPDLLFSLLGLQSPLASLHCWSCGNITASTRDEVTRHIINNFLDINFQWTGVQVEEDNDFLNEEDDLQNLLLPLVGVNVLQNVE